MVGTFVGVLIFLLLLLVAVQVLVRLYVTSELTAAAFSAADAVAVSGANPAEVAVAQQAAQQRLGSFGRAHTAFNWRQVDADAVVLEVRADAPGFLPLPGLRHIDRTVTVRTETFR